MNPIGIKTKKLSGSPVSIQNNQALDADGGSDPIATERSERSYLQIFKSSATIAGSSLVGMVFSIIRNKSAAVWLGPEGVGLMGLFWSIIELAQGLAGGGLLGAGVRQIAEVNGRGDARGVAVTASALRWLSLALGVIGAALLMLFAVPVSSITFGDKTFAGGVVMVSLAVLLRLVASGQMALLQGLRHIGRVARVNILAAILGAFCFVSLIWIFGQRGIVPALIIDGLLLAALGWWFARTITIEKASITAKEISTESIAMLRLGLVFMINGLFMLGATYAVRIIVTHEAGIGAAGLYQAAWGIASLYAGFILQAMGVDFYPRLTEAANDNVKCNRLVNEQTQVSVLLAGPGLIATLTLAPIVVHLFYSAQFNDAVEILRWFCLGMMMRIIAWPMGFIVLAKNEQRIFLFTEIAAASIQTGLAWLLVRQFGAAGAGMAFFGLYVWHSALIAFLVNRLSGFKWSGANIRLGGIYVAASAIVWASFSYLDDWKALCLGLALTAMCGAHSLYSLLMLIPVERLPARLRRFAPK